MSIRSELFEYFDHLRATITVSDLTRDVQRADAVALRHDIDHDLDLALEVAHHEHRRGLRATFFLLHTHDYWRDPDFLLKCRQLEAYGHEIGLHLNVLSEWFAGRVNDVDAALRAILQPLRDAGLTIIGTSAHGDRACYENGFANYWIWRELRSADPAAEQRGRSAEGVRVREEKWQVPYPADHALRRDDGARLELWQSSLAGHGLQYDAMHLPIDHYWSDSGGDWKRSGDPLAHVLSRGRHMVLLHPVWWRGEKKQYFFLSTARSGTTWLSRVIDRAASCRGLHEFTFNHRFEDDEPIADKRTSDDFRSLCARRADALLLLRQSLRWMRQQPGDVAEANIYLEPFLTELRELAPKATLVHLHRDGRDVVRSILNRGWYDNPDDHKHPALPVDGWEQMNRFERACWYWRYVNEAIAPHVTTRIAFESMVRDYEYLSTQLERLGIVVHPLLAAEVLDEPLNRSKQTDVPPHEQWSKKYQQTFARICGSMQRMLGYPSGREASARSVAGARRRTMVDSEPRLLMDMDFTSDAQPTISLLHASAETESAGLRLRAAPATEAGGNVVALLTAGRWNSVAKENGVECAADVFYRCRVHAVCEEGMRARLFILFYDSQGKLVRPFQAGTLRAGEPQREFSFAPAADATHLALAVHLGRSTSASENETESLLLKRVQLESLPMDRGYAATPRGDSAVARRATVTTVAPGAGVAPRES